MPASLVSFSPPVAVLAGPCGLQGVQRTTGPRHGVTSRLLRVAASADDGEGASGEVGDALVDVLRLELAKEEVREELDAYVEAEKAKMQAQADAVKAEIDRVARLNEMRQELSFGSVMADLNENGAEFEAQLREAAEEAARSQDEYYEWEEEIMSSMNEGMFFKSLHKAEGRPPKEGDNDTDASRMMAQVEAEETVEAIRATARAVSGTTREQLNSPFRMWLFTLLTTIMASTCIADAISDSPSWGRIALYAGIAAWMGATAWSERSELHDRL